MALLAIACLKGYKILQVFEGQWEKNIYPNCTYASGKTHPVCTSCFVDSKHVRLHPHHSAAVFPTLPWGGDSGHLYSKKSPLLCGKKHRHMHAHKTLRHLGFIPPRSRTAVAEAFMCCGGQQRNARQTALRAPAEGKLQGAAWHQSFGENAAGALGLHQIISGLAFLSLLIQTDRCAFKASTLCDECYFHWSLTRVLNNSAKNQDFHVLQVFPLNPP